MKHLQHCIKSCTSWLIQLLFLLPLFFKFRIFSLLSFKCFRFNTKNCARMGERHVHFSYVKSLNKICYFILCTYKKIQTVLRKKVHFISFRIVCFQLNSLIYWCLFFFRVFDFKHFSCSPILSKSRKKNSM